MCRETEQRGRAEQNGSRRQKLRNIWRATRRSDAKGKKGEKE